MTTVFFMHGMGWGPLVLVAIGLAALWVLLIHAWSTPREPRRESHPPRRKSS